MATTKRYNPEVPATSFMPQAYHILDSPKIAAILLTAAQLIAMGTTPVSILPAPGVGKAILVDSITFEMVRTATPFTGGGAINFQYHTTTTSAPVTGTVPAAALTTAGAATTLTLLGDQSSATGTTIPSNEGIDITNTGGAFAAGTGTAKVFIRYRVITL